ncbi:hypothetical protein AQJ30_27555 [Streptomyces longwoodensis]|uniref:Uncharacterized protein n=1 Tax=Streptomyces longwoodensis TaxID=68231 RepID=A0A117QLF4_9ACTN|nr:hypothetical protein [Streptomyces longwoodensis]KUN34828.1 hypothetical protein AQJ30_27555 [Streptomyces longwoodensis]
MTLGPFATASDLVARMGRDLDPVEQSQADRLLADASNLIRMTADYQQISRVDNDTVTLRGSYRTVLKLPQRPVRDVTAVAGLASTAWRWNGGDCLIRLDGGVWDGPVTVTYSHGLDEDDVAYQVAVSVACDAVKRVLTNPELVRQRSIDDFSETLADARASLLQGEQDTIRQAFGVTSWGVSS